MKKALAYIATAILLGFAIMMLPRTLETQPTAGTPQPDYAETNFPSRGEDGSKTAPYGLVSQPLNLLPSSLIIFTGLIVALGIYAITKRRIF